MRPAIHPIGDSRRLHLAMPTRTDARTVACPQCGAAAGSLCRRLDGKSLNHNARYIAWREQLRATSDPDPNGGKPHDDRPGKDADKPHPNA